MGRTNPRGQHPTLKRLAEKQGKTRFAGERIAELNEALLPIASQQGKRGDPYNVGSLDEYTWRKQQDHMHNAIQRGQMDRHVVESVLKLRNNPQELKRFMDWSSKRNRRGYPIHEVSRHVDKGVPHAWSSENVYNELLKANGFDSRFNNQVDDMATDLIANINGKDVLIDVQNRSSRGDDVLSLGAIQGLYGENEGLGLEMWKQGDGKRLSTIFEDVRSKMNTQMLPEHIDKLSASRELVGDSYGKDRLIGGRYNPGDIQNLVRTPAAGSYDFVKPADIHNVDLVRLRNEMMRMTKGDLLGEGVVPIRQAQDKLKFSIPMEFVEKLGALNNEMIDPELVKLVRR